MHPDTNVIHLILQQSAAQTDVRCWDGDGLY